MKKKLVEVEYYDCGIDVHRHTTAGANKKCVDVRMNKLKEYYKRLRMCHKILTTRTSIKVLARDFKVTRVVVRNALKICVKELFSNFKQGDLEEHDYPKSMDNITAHTDFWLNKIEIAANITEQKIDIIRDYQ